MLPHEVLRAAAKLIEACGHSQGCHARDVFGREVPLFGGTRGDADVDSSRASINGAAACFSIYGAIAAIVARNPCNPQALWPVLAAEAERSMKGLAVKGGTNHVHPVVLFNEDMDTTKEVALAFLERCAVLIETGQMTMPEPAEPKEEANG